VEAASERARYSFGVLNKESITPWFCLAFETAEDAERRRAIVEVLVENALWYAKEIQVRKVSRGSYACLEEGGS
jgi:hypothetical protein